MIVDIEQLHKELNLTDEQKGKLADALHQLVIKYEPVTHVNNDYFDGVCDGLNHAWKLVQGIDDDYNG